MTEDDVKEVAKAIWEAPINEPGGLRARVWPPLHNHVHQECERQARAAMAETLRIAARDFGDRHEPGQPVRLHEVLHWLEQRAKEIERD